MFLTGPKVVKTVTGEDVTQEQLGGATMHTTKSGVAQFAVDTEEEGIELIRKLISYMPQNNMEDAPLAVCNDSITRLEDSLNDIIPDNANKPYDMAEVIRAIVDNGEYLESAPDTPRTSSPASRVSTASRSASSPTSPSSWPACSTSTPAARPRVSSASAMRSTFRS